MGLKLSEAIRLGAMMKPQGFGAYFTGGGSCAIGAALDAIGRRRLAEVHWPILMCRLDAAMIPVQMPEGCVGTVIAYMNDDYKWTREEIADWVEGIEAQQVDAVVDAPMSMVVDEPVTVS